MVCEIAATVSELLKEAQIAGVEAADVVNAVAHHAEPLHTQTCSETAVALGIEQLAAVTTDDGAKADRRVIGTEHRGADLGNRAPQAARGDGHAIDVAKLPLIGTEAHGGVALDVLDGLEAFARGDLDGTGGDIGDAMSKAMAVQDDPDGNPVDYSDLYCRLVRKAVGDLLLEEKAAIRLWRLAAEFAHDGYSAASLRLCNSCDLAYPWKNTEQRWITTTKKEYWRDTVWEKEHLFDGDGCRHGENPDKNTHKRLPSNCVAFHICYKCVGRREHLDDEGAIKFIAKERNAKQIKRAKSYRDASQYIKEFHVFSEKNLHRPMFLKTVLIFHLPLLGNETGLSL